MKSIANPIIFIGPGRSGSTIISEVVLAHRQLGGPSNYTEWYPSLPVLALLSRCVNNDYWLIHGVKAQLNTTMPFNHLIPRPAEAWSFWQKHTRSDIDFSRNFLINKRATSRERQNIHRAFARLLMLQGKPRLGLKLTGPGRIEYLHSLFPDAYFINVVRDPCATVNSLLNVPFWQQQGAKQLWWEGAYSSEELKTYQQIRYDPVAGTAFQLNKVLETTRREMEYCGVNALTIHYEDFIANPVYTTRKILGFCHLSNDSRVAQRLNTCQVINRNQQTCQNLALTNKVRQWCPS